MTDLKAALNTYLKADLKAALDTNLKVDLKAALHRHTYSLTFATRHVPWGPVVTRPDPS